MNRHYRIVRERFSMRRVTTKTVLASGLSLPSAKRLLYQECFAEHRRRLHLVRKFKASVYVLQRSERSGTEGYVSYRFPGSNGRANVCDVSVIYIDVM